MMLVCAKVYSAKLFVQIRSEYLIHLHWQVWVEWSGKDKVLGLNQAPCHQGICGDGGKVACTLNLGTRWRCMVSLTFWSLYSWGKSCWYLLNGRVGWSKSQSGHFGEQKNFMLLPGIAPHFLGFPACSLVIVPGMLFCLLSEVKRWFIVRWKTDWLTQVLDKHIMKYSHLNQLWSQKCRTQVLSGWYLVINILHNHAKYFVFSTLLLLLGTEVLYMLWFIKQLGNYCTVYSNRVREFVALDD
jgi:hypothetical protein